MIGPTASFFNHSAWSNPCCRRRLVTRPLSLFRLISPLVFVLAVTGPASAQSPADDDAALDLAEPDFTVVNIPTTLRLPVRKADFHLTHRFGKNLRDGSFGDQASVLFGLDSGATIGLELRYGIMRHLEAIVHRSSFDKTIQLAVKYRRRPPGGVDAAVFFRHRLGRGNQQLPGAVERVHGEA